MLQKVIEYNFMLYKKRNPKRNLMTNNSHCIFSIVKKLYRIKVYGILLPAGTNQETLKLSTFLRTLL